ncbi:putative beta-galactosidase [Rosa chinensis]|uniref:Putative beta-galactosidase n=1 Tax=Rosa chinensis TaxID=74649 RepID=A0A2P6QBT1_ROSCH|nr:putative beta-galactosidase [Rosa chinensis]
MNMAHVFSSNPGGCAAFLSNCNAISAATVTFNDRNCEIPACSISVLPDCENFVFNTAKNFAELDVFGVDISPSESFLRGGKHPILTMLSAGNAMHVFVNDQLSVVQQGLDQGSRDLSGQIWSYKVGLNGESMNLSSPTSTSAVNWTRVSKDTESTANDLSNFDAPEGDEPLALDMGSMGKGEVWINGGSIGRYWTVHANGNCSACIYFGIFRIDKCQFGCLQPTQQWYV